MKPRINHPWAATRREAYRRGALVTLERLTTLALADEDYAAAETYARQQLAIDPLHEAANRQLIEILARAGRRSAALHHYDDYRRLLELDLGLQPGSETLSLVKHVRSGEIEAVGARPGAFAVMRSSKSWDAAASALFIAPRRRLSSAR